MTERPDTDTPSPDEPTRVDDGDAVGARAAGSGWAAAEETPTLADEPAAGETAAAAPAAEPEPIPEPQPAAPSDRATDVGTGAFAAREATARGETPTPAPVVAPDPSTSSSPPPASSGSASTGDRPERVVGGAFAGGLVLGLILKRVGN